jgi:putative NADH-flavin reductase
VHLAVFGGTGRVGRRLIRAALEAGHSVQALVRAPEKLEIHPGLTALAGDVLDPAAVARTIEGTEAVLSTLGGAGLADPGNSLSQGMKNITAAMARLGVRRVLAVAGSGVLDHPGGGLRYQQPGFPELFLPITREHLGTYQALSASDLDWTLVCTPDLPDGEATGSHRVQADLLPEGGTQIPTGEVAAFLLQELERRRFVRRRAGLAT